MLLLNLRFWQFFACSKTAPKFRPKNASRCTNAVQRWPKMRPKTARSIIRQCDIAVHFSFDIVVFACSKSAPKFRPKKRFPVYQCRAKVTKNAHQNRPTEEPSQPVWAIAPPSRAQNAQNFRPFRPFPQLSNFLSVTARYPVCLCPNHASEPRAEHHPTPRFRTPREASSAGVT